MTGPATSPRTLTSAELDALPVGTAVRCTTERGMRVVLALKVGTPQSSGGHVWRTTEYSTVPGSFAIAQAGAVLLEPVEPGHRAPDVQVDGDNPALAATTVQDDALTGAGQGSDVGNARHEPVVGQSRHDASRDIPSSAGGPAATPALARATHTLSEWLNDNAPIGEQIYANPARATVSAALHDHDDPAWLPGVIVAAIRDFHSGPASQPIGAHVADAVRTAILGARGNERDGGQA